MGKAKMVFSGFPAGRMRMVAVPSLFFSELLPEIDNLNELKVTLHILWRLDAKPGYPRYLSLSELLRDATLLEGLQGGDLAPEGRLLDGLRRAVDRGVLLVAAADKPDGGQEAFYLLNSDKGRLAMEQWRKGEIRLMESASGPASLKSERPNIFILYEQNIGLLQPMIAEELREAESAYPAEWIEDAFREAAAQNKRNWRYIQRILERWATDGRGRPTEGKGDLRSGDLGSHDDRRRYVEGKYAEYFKHDHKKG
jgi:DNA replication protein